MKSFATYSGSPASPHQKSNSHSQGDLSGLERAAHAIKGSVGNYAARHAVGVAFDLEKAARNAYLAACCRLSSVLEAEMEALKPEITFLGKKMT
jgi:HPt (histidine-containing phosphotransfer) domain-containing protein